LHPYSTESKADSPLLNFVHALLAASIYPFGTQVLITTGLIYLLISN
jgi:hypothetical protein